MQSERILLESKHEHAEREGEVALLKLASSYLVSKWQVAHLTDTDATGMWLLDPLEYKVDDTDQHRSPDIHAEYNRLWGTASTHAQTP
ncbi:hypothetical protein NDU88_002267 [Pleurodeles waltl]|uniref:Uncharacterized protein n=1 Tax=Pleurodeles waltl TaxID=8319 RepID=A0AAV7R9H9_PLEWA|nr:hypothetical protein NDU88_002267 [Pleurodeles waltl]